MRLFSSWQQYLATAGDGGLQIHQYASADIDADIDAGTAGQPVRVEVRTAYPWQGRISVRIAETPDEPWTLSLRVPGWCRAATLTDADGVTAPVAAGMLERTRRWRAGDTVVLDLDLPVRVTEPDPRVDAVRGCVAFERGPLVYCLESTDLPRPLPLEDFRWDPRRQPVPRPRPELGDTVVGISVPVVQRDAAGSAAEDLTAGAVPYYAWANRRVGAMRVWLPR
jgi:DUF1680 family protein